MAESSTSGRSGLARRLDPLEALVRVVQAGPALVLVALLVVFLIIAPYFDSPNNIKNLLIAASPIALLSIGQLVVIITRGIDLSVGSTIALASVVGAALSAGGAEPAAVIAAMLGIGLLVGVTNGVVIAYIGIKNPFIVTLGMLSIVSGAAIVVSGAKTYTGLPTIMVQLGTSTLFGLPWAVILVIATAIVIGVILTGTRTGRWLYAIGGNPDAAERVGIPVRRVTFTAYVISGLCAGLASLIIVGRQDAGYPTLGQGSELESIAAVVIGGASFFGGRGSIINAIVGAATIATIRNGLNLAGISPDWQIIVIGFVLVLAVGSDFIRAGLETRLRSHYSKER